MEKKPKILLVEDEEILRESLALYLSRCGYDVTEAGDVREALGHARADKCMNLVVTDLMLPDGDCYGIMSFVAETCPETKCIVITGHASLESAIWTYT